ncbi:MAG: ADP-polyphosphate phosphotransferase [Paraperlucidibaca sp.]
MKIDASEFQVPAGKDVNLEHWPTRVRPLYSSKKQYRKLRQGQVEQLTELQQLHYASSRHSLLLIFQGMDAAGKDGAIRRVMSGVNPQGCQVTCFKHPSVAELEHDFLWRSAQCLPERGRIGIFNRSYYEETLIARVHPEILHSQGLPAELLNEKTIWQERFQSIINHEGHLHRNGTRIIKFFLHLSKEEQRKRFLKRIDRPEKNWKLTAADINEREFWQQYMHAYEQCISATSTDDAPWYIVPADNKKNAQLIVSQIILKTYQSFKMHYPETDAARRKELLAIRHKLTSES